MCPYAVRTSDPYLQGFYHSHFWLFFVFQVWLSDNIAGECLWGFHNCVYVSDQHKLYPLLSLFCHPGVIIPDLFCHFCQIHIDSEQTKVSILENHGLDEAFTIYYISYTVCLHVCLSRRVCICKRLRLFHAKLWFALLKKDCKWPKGSRIFCGCENTKSLSLSTPSVWACLNAQQWPLLSPTAFSTTLHISWLCTHYEQINSLRYCAKDEQHTWC